MKRKPSLPDTRPNWRDPNMSVIREYKFANGATKTEVDPDYESRYRDMLVKSTPHDDWRNDLTYNLRKGKP